MTMEMWPALQAISTRLVSIADLAHDGVSSEPAIRVC
jgi:hypothetical protein